MFNLQGSEIIFILLLALVVLGPEKLPDAIRRFTKTYGELKKMGAGFESELRSVMEEPAREVRETAGLLRDAADPDKLASARARTPLDADEPPASSEEATGGDAKGADDAAADATTGDDVAGDDADGDDAAGDATTGDDADGDDAAGDATTGDATTGDDVVGDATTGDAVGEDATSGEVASGDRPTGGPPTDEGDRAAGGAVPTEVAPDPGTPAAAPAPPRPVNRVAAANSSAALVEAAAAANGARSGDRATDDDPTGTRRGGRDVGEELPADDSHESDADDVAERGHRHGDRAART